MTAKVALMRLIVWLDIVFNSCSWESCIIRQQCGQYKGPLVIAYLLKRALDRLSHCLCNHELHMLSQNIASWPFVSSIASRIGSRHTGQVTEQSSSEHEGRLSSIEREGRLFSEFDGKLSFGNLKNIFFLQAFLLVNRLSSTTHTLRFSLNQSWRR